MPLEAQTDALVGRVLEGRFQVERLLGEGGMGRVYVADETRLRRRCALKVLLPELTQDKDCVERFLREAQAIAQIHHENVVDIYHLGEDQEQGVVFFAMELLAGEDLETRLLDRARRPLGWSQVCQWMAQISGAMAAVHAAGMIHRDLKPSNVFITRRRDGRDQIKLLDFGIAKIAHHAALTSTGAAIGTPFYMSPEQILAQPLDARTDIYSLGVVFYEALAGRMPFVGEPIQVAMQHCNVPPQPISALAPDVEVPREVENLVMRMLAKDREARPQSMEDIEALLIELTASTSSGLMASGLHARPSTGPLGASGASTPPPGAAEAKTQLIGSTPPQGLAPAAPPEARTSLEFVRPPATTVEIDLDPDGARPAGSSRKWVALLLLSAAVLAAIFLGTGLLGDGPDPPTPPPDGPAVVAAADPPPPVDPPPRPQDGPRTEPAFDPVPADTSAGSDKPEEPKTQPTRKTGDASRPGERTTDPRKQLAKAAASCRKQHKAVKGPKITIDYGTNSDGTVSRAVPSVQDALGKCLAEAVKKTKFAPQLKLGQKIDL